MKVLVYQSHVKHHDNRPFRHELAIASKKSFQKYAERHGYDYKCDEKGWIEPLEQQAHTKFFYAFQGLTHKEYDFIIYADSDVIAQENAPAFPFKEGISVVPQKIAYSPIIRDESLIIKQDTWVKEHLSAYQVQNHDYFNSGVWCVSRSLADYIWENWREVRNSCKNKNLNGVQLDQPVLNACVAGKDINHLSYKWNAVSDWLKPAFYKKAYFIHYAGLLGSLLWKTKHFVGRPEKLRERLGSLLFNHFVGDMGRYGKTPMQEALTEIINKQFNHG